MKTGHGASRMKRSGVHHQQWPMATLVCEVVGGQHGPYLSGSGGHAHVDSWFLAYYDANLTGVHQQSACKLELCLHSSDGTAMSWAREQWRLKSASRTARFKLVNAG
jgi:hypothetical protein